MSFSNPRRRMMTRSESIAEKKMTTKAVTSLQKGATFHSPSSPKFHNLDDDYLPPRLMRSQSHLNDVSANRRRMILTSTIEDVDRALANISLSDSKPKKQSPLSDTATPIPRRFFPLPVVDPAMAIEQERRVLRPRSARRNRHHASDSGLGTSVASTSDKASAADTLPNNITKQQAATRTATASNQNLAPALSLETANKIRDHTLTPLSEKPSLKPFETMVLDIYSRIQSKDITCLRDVEKALFNIASVSRLLTGVGVWSDAYQNLPLEKHVKTAALYVEFNFSSIHCLQATVGHVPENERILPGDQPYTNGYFIDLKQQILEYGRVLATQQNGDLPEDMNIDKGDEVRLFGGPCVNGRSAELVRVKKDGTAFSMATGKPVDLNEAPIKFKRSLSEQLDDDEEIMRSMARRKKNATPEELAPKKCRQPGCNKEFKRPCDLTKHEKTHSRPWKCPFPTCKYHKYGWPTEKEMDRHVNDKHTDAPAMHECLFKPCVYTSKRESNCKQHMEKTHNWTYIRTKSSGKTKTSGKTKSSGKKLPLKPANMDTPAITNLSPPITNLSPPITTPSYSVPTPPQNVPQAMPVDFTMYPGEPDWLTSVELIPKDIDRDLPENQSPSSSASSYEQYPPYQNGSTFIINDEDLYAARMQLPWHMPIAEQIYNKMMTEQMPDFQMAPPTAVPHMEVPTHFSPTGQGNTMLYTPVSSCDMDEAFDDAFGGHDVDFQLFDTSVSKFNEGQSLFGELPSANLGFSQNTQPEIFADVDLTALDTLDYSTFQT